MTAKFQQERSICHTPQTLEHKGVRVLSIRPTLSRENRAKRTEEVAVNGELTLDNPVPRQTTLAPATSSASLSDTYSLT